MTLVYLSFAWIAGIYFGTKIALPLGVVFLGLLPFCLFPLFPHHRKTLFLVGFCLFTFLGGVFRFQSSLPAVSEHCLCFYNDKGIVEIKGMVSNDPEARGAASVFQFSATKLRINDESKRVSGTALIRMPRYPAYHYGDVLRVTGKLETPPQIDDFDYKDYLARQGIYSILYYPKIEMLDSGKGSKLLGWVYTMRNRLSQNLSATLPEPQGSLAQGILLGIRGEIPFSLNQAFSRTGTAHILAISGINLSIIIGMLLSLGLWLFGKRYSLYIWLALLTIWLYALFTGMRPPVVRGAIMGSLFLMAEYLGRQRSALIALAFAAAIMTGIQPQLLWNVAFQLSFLAMAGLILLSPSFQAWGRKTISASLSNEGTIASLANLVSDGFAVTLSAILATWPVIAYNFDIISSVGPPATFFALLALPGIIITTALVSIVGLLSLPLAQVLGWVAWLLLSYFMLVIRAFDALPLSSFQVNTIQGWQVWSYYALLVAIIGVVNYKRQLASFFSHVISGVNQLGNDVPKLVSKLPKKWVIPPLVIIAILVWAAALTMPDDRLRISFLDVGQGDAILIQTPCHQNILIDGGPSPQEITLELSKKLPFWDRTIDLIILTQPQADHVTGLVAVLQRYKVKQVLEPGIPYSSLVYDEWLKLMRDKEIKYTIPRAGQGIDLGNGVSIEVLHPPSPLLHGTADDIDNNGLVLRLSWGKISFLFTTDIGKEAEWYLIAQRANLPSTVLKVAHHGSQTATTTQFLAAVDPKIAVISASADNPFGHPHSEVMERLIGKLSKDRVYLTSEHGTIEFITNGKRLWVKTEK